MAIREKFSDLLKQGYSLHYRLDNAIVIVNDKGNLEFWCKSDGVASYAIVFEGHDYEFCTSNDEAITNAIQNHKEEQYLK